MSGTSTPSVKHRALVMRACLLSANSWMMRARVPVGVLPETWKVSIGACDRYALVKVSLWARNSSARWMLLWNETACRRYTRQAETPAAVTRCATDKLDGNNRGRDARATGADR